MKYILKYETQSKYLHFTKQFYKEFVNMDELRLFLLDNINNIMIYSIYKLSDLTGK